MSEFSREEIKAAFDNRIALQESNDWDGYTDTFTEDAVYVDHHEGTFEGKEAIRKWLVAVMAPCEGWTFPVEWVVFEGDRIISKWFNRLPGQRVDGSHYEFAGITVMIYAGNGLFSYQEDMYNWEKAVPLLEEWSEAQSA